MPVLSAQQNDSINRNIVECKVSTLGSLNLKDSGINRNIVECKEQLGIL